jgi:hypothetical protein
MQEAQEQQPSSPAGASNESPETVTEELQQSEQQEAADKPEEGDEGDDQGGEEKLHEKPKRSARERINELTKRAHEAEREVQRLREASERKPAESTEKPIPDRFGSYDEYVEALADWKADQRVAESFKRRDAERSQAAEARAAEAKAQAWAERQIEFREATPDYDGVVGKSCSANCPHVVDTLLDSESGPELAYHLAKRPETVKRINALSPPLGSARTRTDRGDAIESGRATIQAGQQSACADYASSIVRACGSRLGICKHGPVHRRTSQTRRDIQAAVIHIITEQ